MGASWVEVDRLVRAIAELAGFPHAEALPAVVHARDLMAETAVAVARAGASDDEAAEREAHDRLARVRVALLDAQRAVRLAREAAALFHAGRERAERLLAEATRLRAGDGSGGRPGRPNFILGAAATASSPAGGGPS